MLDTVQIEDAFSYHNNKRNIVSIILNLNLQHEENELAIINVINKYLNNSKQCREGLEFLDLLIKNVRASVIQENALNWVNHCLIKYSDDILKELRLRVLGRIVEVSHTESDFSKKFASDYLSKIFESCITTSNVNVYECVTALKTLTICMKCYPNWFGTHRVKIEKFLVQFLDSDCDNLVLNAALAFHILQQTGSAGSNSINYKVHFSENFSKLCRTANSLFDIWFKNETEQYTNENSNEVYEFHNDSRQNAKAELDITSRRICNVLKFIKIMIKTSFPAAKETKPKDLIYLVRRGLAFHNCISNTEKQSLVSNHSASLLNQIQISLLNLLRLCIIWYGTNILPFSYTISKILIDNVELLHKCNCLKFNSLYQESTYKALQDWFPIARSSFHPQFQSQFLACILKDIVPVKPQVTLTISESETGKKSQKAKRKAVAEKIISSNKKGYQTESSTLYAKHCECITTKLVLKSLKKLIVFTNLKITSSEIERLYAALFETLTNIQLSQPIHPYTDPNCQVCIYDVLISLFSQETLNPLPPLQASLDILNIGLNGKNKHIVDICESGLRFIELLCQPACPSLYFGAVKRVEDECFNGDHYENGMEFEDVYGDFDVNIMSTNTEVSSKDVLNSKNYDEYYDVNQPESEHSFVEENLNNKNPNADGVNFEEVSADTNTDNIKQHKPTVTAPSEDGNEILEEGDMVNYDSKAEKDNPQHKASGVEKDTNKVDSVKSSATKESNIDENIEKVGNEEINSPRSQADDANNKPLNNSNGTVLNQPNEERDHDKDLGDKFEECSSYSDKAASGKTNVEDEDKDLGDKFEEKFERGSEANTHPDEPVAKRAKLQYEEDLGDTFVEGCEDEDNLDSFSQEDSFIDEVKGY
ncbi:hypothetical protein GWI33_008195 [Rhynchophorus ferrugineus]|uniref:Pre-rRNA-processing protein RIX1 N-terminal domain-containing protein n=1 Tax=Rhynchophorus ferrugineus TaxID=354439 RepID=A0A834IIN3_RHYFE|nr:hypothetical protein GWI33_008195 [Rhynchophorus ferrugineus]